MSVAHYTPQWPPWSKSWVDCYKGEVHIEVKFGQFSEQFVVPQGQARSHDTQRIMVQLYQSLKDKQARLDAVTKRITK